MAWHSLTTSLAGGSEGARPAVRWPPTADDIVHGDLVVILATVTAAQGVVLTPMANIGLCDRGRGTVTATTSLGLWHKLKRIERNPHVALAFHTRDHGSAERPEYVLIQGKASFSWTPDQAWLESIGENWDRSLGARTAGPIWDRWLRVYHWERVGVEIGADRVVVWPDLDCAGTPETYGAPLPGDPAPQRVPAHGAAPRIKHGRAAAKSQRLPRVLLGWVGADGAPVVVPVKVVRAEREGILLDVPDGLLPPGGRRAGLCAHGFSDQVIGEEQRVYSGWLTSQSSRRALYAPHTKRGYWLPGSKLAYRLAVGVVTRRGYRRAQRIGLLPAGDGNR